MVDKYRNILILTASFGDGHLQVSQVMEQAFNRLGYSSVRIIDLLQEAHPVLNAVTRFVYLRSPVFSALGFDYYGWSYYYTRNLKTNSVLAKRINRLGMRRLLDVIREEQPSAIVLTFPFGGISDQLRNQMFNIPIFTIVTDFGLHNRWLYTNSQQFYVATEDLKQSMIKSGVRRDRITVSGIPVREAFCDTMPHERMPHHRSILVMAGAHGLLPDISMMIGQLLLIPDVEVIIVCGKNNKLRRELEDQFKRKPQVRLLGYVHKLHQFMRNASCMVTKAGGITLSEAIQLRTPILIFKPFPGQERENALYLENKGAAFVCNDVAELKEQAERLLGDTPEKQMTRESLRSLNYGHAAITIAGDIIRRQQATISEGESIVNEA
ncbi:MGDG synthase family glycosyltransferase [Paenibacillus harenae]|uniref:MGDG synthase family glycosyltransferase n=1 Tax=Paenibacillus harenae TaxID=306543 RepID=UPI000406B11A|nr:glycosyltransferase [Paenibacillus harenae]